MLINHASTAFIGLRSSLRWRNQNNALIFILLHYCYTAHWHWERRSRISQYVPLRLMIHAHSTIANILTLFSYCIFTCTKLRPIIGIFLWISRYSIYRSLLFSLLHTSLYLSLRGYWNIRILMMGCHHWISWMRSSPWAARCVDLSNFAIWRWRTQKCISRFLIFHENRSICRHADESAIGHHDTLRRHLPSE